MRIVYPGRLSIKKTILKSITGLIYFSRGKSSSRATSSRKTSARFFRHINKAKLAREGEKAWPTVPSPTSWKLEKLDWLDRQGDSVNYWQKFQSPPAKVKEWPTAVLKSAYESGRLSTKPEISEAILNDLAHIPVKALCSSMEHTRCIVSPQQALINCTSEYAIEPNWFSTIARILAHSRDQAYRSTYKYLLHSASDLRDPAATFLLVQTSLYRKNQRGLTEPIQHLSYLAAEKHPVAVYLQGRIHEQQGNLNSALKHFEECLALPNGTYPGSEDVGITTGQVWIDIHRLKKGRDDDKGAETAIRTAALEHDDPYAYHTLAAEYTDPSTPEYERYMLTAAESGQTAGAESLGLYYMNQALPASSSALIKSIVLDKRIPPPSPTEKDQPSVPKRNVFRLKLAIEWFTIGAEADRPSSQLYLAILIHALGNAAVAQSWLEKAQESSECKRAAGLVQQRWEAGQSDFFKM